MLVQFGRAFASFSTCQCSHYEVKGAIMDTRTIRLAQVLSLLVGLALPTLSAAQAANPWEQQVRQQLVYATLALDLGYEIEPSHAPYMAQLNNNTYVDVPYTLEAGVSYVFLGVCDSDCSGLQLRLYDGYWHLVSQFTTRGGYPYVATSVGQSGVFYLRITMRECRINPCWLGVGAYR